MKWRNKSLTLDRAAADSGLTLDGAATNYHYLPLIATISGDGAATNYHYLPLIATISGDRADTNYHYLPLFATISGESVSQKGSGIGHLTGCELP